jgi:hypothetical protein
MKLSELFEGYDPKHKCRTPGAVYDTRLHDKSATISISFGKKIDLTEKEAKDLEAEFHYALEGVLAQFYKKERDARDKAEKK